MSRILLEARSLSTLGGGVRTYTMEVIRRLLGAATPHEFHVVYDAAQYRGTFPAAQEHVVPVGHPLFRLAWDMTLLPMAASRIHPDLIHYFKPATTILPKPRSVATVYDIIPLLFPEMQTAIQRSYWNIQLPLTIRTCNHLLTISEQSKRDIVERFHIPPERVTVTPLGVHERFTPTSPEEIARTRAKLSLPKEFLLFLGTIEPRKNIARLVRAFASIAAQVPHHLVIAGKWGWKSEDVREALRDPRVSGRVLYLSYVPSELLPALYGTADAFVFPSLYEGFGLPPLEAMACGTPVITSNVSSLPEAVGPHALLVPPGDEQAIAGAMKRLVLDRELHDRLSREGKAWAQQCTWDRTAHQTLAVYNALLAQ